MSNQAIESKRPKTTAEAANVLISSDVMTSLMFVYPAVTNPAAAVAAACRSLPPTCSSRNTGESLPSDPLPVSSLQPAQGAHSAQVYQLWLLLLDSSLSFTLSRALHARGSSLLPHGFVDEAHLVIHNQQRACSPGRGSRASISTQVNSRARRLLLLTWPPADGTNSGAPS
ncbi:hypothetical protein BaRGS_00010008 [Batillaria attramentaria]|uniref:Uncharacterized protein n=1 Tax=Batillaria attramentaria TaxID=370345 RepID=A0ABD0LI59_9CAEN